MRRPPAPTPPSSNPAAAPAAEPTAAPSDGRRARLVTVSRGIGRPLLAIDRSKISVGMAIRNTIGVAVPLLACMALGDRSLAIVVGFAANMVAISDQAGPDLTKFPRLMAATLGVTVATVAGTLAGGNTAVLFALVALWSFAAGMLAAFGMGALQVGIASILALFFTSAHPHGLATALALGGIVLLAGLFQTGVSTFPRHVPPWMPGLRTTHPPEQKALARALRLEARFARNPASSGGDGPGNTALVEASRLLRGQPHPDAAAIGSAVLEACYRLQTSLIAVHRTVAEHTAELGGRVLAIQTTAMQEVSRTILLVANALDRDRPDANALARRLDALDRALDSLALAADEDVSRLDAASPHVLPGPAERQRIWLARLHLLDRLRSLQGVIRELTRLANDPRLSQRVAPTASTLWRVVRIHLADARSTIAANLTMESAAFRHALRLSASILAASLLALVLDLAHGYWAPMAATIILRPQFGITMTRGIARLIGTALGLGIGTVIVILLPAGTGPLVATLLVLIFCFRLLAPGNNVLATTAISAWVVALLALMNVPPETAVADRSIATLLGGGVALGIFLLWPTWEYSRISTTLARMVDTLRATARAVLADLLDPGASSPAEIHRLRLASRLARANAAASVARLAEEPRVPLPVLELATLLVRETRQLAITILALENSLHDLARKDGIEPMRRPLDRARDELDAALAWLAAALQSPGQPPPEDPSVALRQAADAVQFAATHQAAMLVPEASPTSAGDEDADPAIATTPARESAFAALGVGYEMQQAAALVSAMIAQVQVVLTNPAPADIEGEVPSGEHVPSTPAPAAAAGERSSAASPRPSAPGP